MTETWGARPLSRPPPRPPTGAPPSGRDQGTGTGTPAERLGGPLYDEVSARMEKGGRRVAKFREMSRADFSAAVLSMALAYTRGARQDGEAGA